MPTDVFDLAEQKMRVPAQKTRDVFDEAEQKQMEFKPPPSLALPPTGILRGTEQRSTSPLTGFDEQHPILGKALDVLAPRSPHKTVEAVGQALKDLPGVFTEAIEVPAGADATTRALVRVNKSVQRVGRLAKDVATLGFSPFSAMLSPIAPEIEKVVTPLSNLLKGTYIGGAEIRPEFRNKSLWEIVNTAGAVRTGNENLDAIVDEAAGFLPFVAAGEVVRARGRGYQPISPEQAKAALPALTRMEAREKAAAVPPPEAAAPLAPAVAPVAPRPVVPPPPPKIEVPPTAPEAAVKPEVAPPAKPDVFDQAAAPPTALSKDATARWRTMMTTQPEPGQRTAIFERERLPGHAKDLQDELIRAGKVRIREDGRTVEPVAEAAAPAAPAPAKAEVPLRTEEQRAKEQAVSERVFGKPPDAEAIVRTHLEKLAKSGKYGLVGANERIWKELPIETKKLGGERVTELLRSVFTETQRRALEAEAKKFPTETVPRAVEPYEKPPVRPDIDAMSREELTAELPLAQKRVAVIRDEIAKYGPSPDRTKLGLLLEEAYDWVGKVDRAIKFREAEAAKPTEEVKPKVAGGLTEKELDSLTVRSGVDRTDVQSLIDRGFAKVTKKGFGSVVFIEPTAKGSLALNEYEAKGYERRVAGAHELTPEAANTKPPTERKAKLEFQRQYFVDALKPVQKAWVKAIKETNTPLGNELVEALESGAKLGKVEKANLDRFAKERPEAFKENQLHIKVPSDGEFLLYNNPSVVVQAMADAKAMFAPSKGAEPLKPQRVSSRGPTEAMLRAAIANAEADLELAEKKYKNPEGGDFGPGEREAWIAAQRENIQTMKDTLAEKGTTEPKGPSGGAYGEPYGSKTRYVIAEHSGSGEGKILWTPIRGRQYTNRAKAEAAYAELEQRWEASVQAGRKHPSWAGKFRQNVELIEIPEGKSFADIINAMPGRKAATLGGAVTKGPSGTTYGEPYGQRAGRVVVPKVERVNAPRELISKGEIVKQLSAKLAELPIRVGHFKQRALGIYKTQEESVRLRKALDFPTIFHEVGHHINKLLWGTYSKKTNAFELNWKPLKAFRSELKPPNFGYRPHGRSYLPESFADFIAAYVIDPATAKAKAPKFSAFFENELTRLPDVRDVLENSRADVLRWLEQPAQARILAHISKEEAPVPQNRFDRVMAATVDALRPLQKVVNELSLGGRVPTEQNAYELARLLAGWAGKAEHFLERGTFKAGSLEVTGKPLKAILEPVEGKLDDLRTYLVAKRAVEKGAQGKASGLEMDDVVTALKELETPEMQKVAQELYAYNDATLLYLKDSGYFSHEQYTQIREMNKNYVPFYRVMEEAPGAPSRGGGKTLADLWNPVKRMRGSGREIIDPLESIVKNTYTFINLAERNRVGLALAKQARSVEGAGKWIEEVPGPQKATKFELEEIKKALIEAGVEASLGGPDGMTLFGEGGKPLDLDTVAMVFRPSGIAPKGENILTVRENGKSRFYQVHPELYRSLKALDQDQSNMLVKILSAPARLLRLGATGLSPEFVIRNPVRDAWTAFLQSRNGFVPGVDSFRGLFHALKRDDLYWEWKRAGGEHAALVSMDRTTLQGELNDLMRSPLENVVRHPIEAMRQLGEWTEAATRLGEYQLARKAGKTPRQAAFESREVTLDFARIGNSTRAVNSIIAFWNAAVQGTDKFARTHIENPRGTVVKALAGVTVPSILLYLANRKDPDYQELPRWQKDFFWMVPTGRKKVPWVRIPKPFLWGMVYGSTVERTLEWIDTRDAHALDELAGNVAQSAFPSIVPTAALPIVEAYANRSMFREAPLDPRYLERVTPEYRVTERTSQWSQKTALALAKMGIHISPNKLDNTLFGYTGGLGTTIVRATDIIAGDGKRPAMRPSDFPLVRGFVVSTPGRESQSVQQFYDRLEELEQKQGTLGYEKRYPGRISGAPELSVEEKQELYRLRYANQQMQNINQQIRRTSSDPQLSPAEKRTKLDELNARALATARRALRKDQPHYRLNAPTGLLQQGVHQ